MRASTYLVTSAVTAAIGALSFKAFGIWTTTAVCCVVSLYLLGMAVKES